VIESVAFGKIVIDGKPYTSDVLIFPDGSVADGWRRRSGHRLGSEDIQQLVAVRPTVLIAGTGAFGRMKPATELEDSLRQEGIRFIAASNRKAAELYNRLAPEHPVAACFHLTC
jgi:hypothetical protein